VTHWLQNNGFDSDLINIFQQNKITVENLKYLKESDLISFGIKEWGTRISILEAINKYYSVLPNWYYSKSKKIYE